MAATSITIHVFLDGHEVNDKLITRQVAKGSLRLSWSPNSQLKTIIIYDQDAPYPPPQNINSPFIHMIAVNVTDTISEYIFPYISPEPPLDSAPHTYYVDLYQQAGPVTLRARDARAKFDVYKFALNNNMTLIARTAFKVGDETKITSDSSHLLPSYPEDGINFKSTSSLTEEQKKHCRCRLKVAAKNPESCSSSEWGSKGCYNPYAICSRAGSRIRSCSEDYDFDTMSDKYLIAYAHLHNISISSPYNRMELLSRVKK